MRVFMLGWEFPPFITGGLGTACFGLTKALSRQDVHVTFVLPKHVGEEYTEHVRLLSPQAPSAAHGDRRGPAVSSSYEVVNPPTTTSAAGHPEFANVDFKAVPAMLPSPYVSAAMQAEQAQEKATQKKTIERVDPSRPVSVLGSVWSGPGLQYTGDLMTEARRYAGLCADLARDEDFDVVHAHDWLTFPAGMAVAAVTGRPLVVHVHSTEFDRCGDNVNSIVYDIERRGMHAATKVIAVSHLTKSIISNRYGVHPDKVEVVYNGIDSGNGTFGQDPGRATIRKGDKIVLFLGRITMQKGPEYFVAAAKKVLEKIDNVKFIMAGSGDKVRDVIELAAAEGIGHKVLFTGFLSGKDVQKVFAMADVYVMPSVSEPFGIAPLEAITHDVPVIISKTSGVAEVLTHALKVDFWDTHEIANKIIAVLKHPPLSSTLRQHADIEVRRLTWEDAARKTAGVYEKAVGAFG